jgi:hypothetical protein
MCLVSFINAKKRQARFISCDHARACRCRKSTDIRDVRNLAHLRQDHVSLQQRWFVISRPLTLTCDLIGQHAPHLAGQNLACRRRHGVGGSRDLQPRVCHACRARPPSDRYVRRNRWNPPQFERRAVDRSVSCQFATMSGFAVDTSTYHEFYRTFRIKIGTPAATRILQRRPVAAMVEPGRSPSMITDQAVSPRRHSYGTLSPRRSSEGCEIGP